MSQNSRPGIVCWASMPIQGTAERKARPVLVVSSQPFTGRTGLVHLLPITTTPPSRWETLPARLAPGSGKLDPKSRIVLDILITEDAKVLGEKLGEVEPGLLAKAVRGFAATLETE